MNIEAIKEKIRLELAKGNESLKGAEVLLKENLFDESVSSAYYAMFHAVKSLLHTIGEDPSTHQGAITLFSLNFIKSKLIEEEYGDLFIEAKDDREDSDYDITRNFTKPEAEERLFSANRFLSRIKEYLSKNRYI